VSFVKGLRCRECGRTYPVSPVYVCDACFGPLEVQYDYPALRSHISRERIEGGPPTMWRYRDLLPVETEEPVDLGAGFTPLVRARNLGRVLGLRELYIKNDAVNPTYSYKDRVVSVAVTKALEFGFDTVACASTGNLSGSVAAHAARAGLPCYIFIPADLERGKVVGTLIYGPTLVAVRGTYDQVNRLSTEIADRYGWAFVNINLRPYYSEGAKTLAFEVIEQLGWEAPDHVVVPVAGATLISKLIKGYQEAYQLGLVDRLRTKISAAQPAGCCPVVDAIRRNLDHPEPVRPNTLARSLAIGNPADGYYAVKAVRTTGGYAEAVTDEEIVEGIKLLARTEGIFTETAGGVTVAALKRLVEQGKIGPDERTVIYITGNGLKTVEALEGRLELPYTIEPTLASFEGLVPALPKSA